MVADAHHEGFKAFCRGVARRDNPWVAGLREWQEWFSGWDSARRQSLPADDIDALADAHEESRYEDCGEAAYGRCD